MPSMSASIARPREAERDESVDHRPGEPEVARQHRRVPRLRQGVGSIEVAVVTEPDPLVPLRRGSCRAIRSRTGAGGPWTCHRDVEVVERLGPSATQRPRAPACRASPRKILNSSRAASSRRSDTFRSTSRMARSSSPTIQSHSPVRRMSSAMLPSVTISLLAPAGRVARTRRSRAPRPRPSRAGRRARGRWSRAPRSRRRPRASGHAARRGRGHPPPTPSPPRAVPPNWAIDAFARHGGSARPSRPRPCVPRPEGAVPRRPAARSAREELDRVGQVRDHLERGPGGPRGLDLRQRTQDLRTLHARRCRDPSRAAPSSAFDGAAPIVGEALANRHGCGARTRAGRTGRCRTRAARSARAGRRARRRPWRPRAPARGTTTAWRVAPSATARSAAPRSAIRAWAASASASVAVGRRPVGREVVGGERAGQLVVAERLEEAGGGEVPARRSRATACRRRPRG